MNRTVFLDDVRAGLFKRSLSALQIETMNAILDYYLTAHADKPLEWLAYILATAYHETGMQYNRREMLGKPGTYAYRQQQKYLPWYGRGLCQCTWRGNYLKVGDLLKIDLVSSPDKLLDKVHSVRCLVDGMILGVFTGERHGNSYTGKKFADYTTTSPTGTVAFDSINARRIVNGTDKAKLIAGYYNEFLDALWKARDQVPSTLPHLSPQGKLIQAPPIPTDPPDGKPLTRSTTAASAVALATVGGTAIQAAGYPPWITYAALGFCAVLALWIIVERRRKSREDGV